MKKIRYGLIVLAMLLSSLASAEAGVSVAIGLPNLSIGINLPLYPQLTPVPGYPVYYAPQVDGNYFFYDGMYWVFQDDNWYASSWYNGPWGFVEPTAVPLFVLRIPVRYYRQPPSYFRGWHSNAAPRWGQHYGHEWEQHRRGWDKWNRRSVPARAPQPTYQRHYTGDRYPHQPEQQHRVYKQKYSYQPRDKAVRQHFNQQGRQGSPDPAHRGRNDAPQMREQQQEQERSPQHQQSAPTVQDNRPQPGVQQREQQNPRIREQEQRHQDRGGAQEPDRGKGRGHNKDEDRGSGNKDEDRGRGRDK